MGWSEVVVLVGWGGGWDWFGSSSVLCGWWVRELIVFYQCLLFCVPFDNDAAGVWYCAIHMTDVVTYMSALFV